MKQERIFTPGPTFIPQRIHDAMRVSTMHHRTKEFEDIFHAARLGLAELAGSSELPVLLACSGTGALEASLMTLLREGDSLIYLNAGKFGERWGDIAARLRIHAIELKVPWGESCSTDALEQIIREHPEAKLFCIQHLETSTTVQHPVVEFANLLRKTRPDMLVAVDAISSFATSALSLENSGIDILIGGSQKALMLPPGLAFVSMSERAWAFASEQKKKSLVPSLYFDLLHEKAVQDKSHNSAWTPAMTLVLGLAEALRMITEEGQSNLFDRHDRASKRVRAFLKSLGFKTISDKHPAAGVTGAFPPDRFSGNDIKDRLEKDFQMKIAGGQDAWSGKIIRIGHMGHFDDSDLDALFKALQEICE